MPAGLDAQESTMGAGLSVGVVSNGIAFAQRFAVQGYNV